MVYYYQYSNMQLDAQIVYLNPGTVTVPDLLLLKMILVISAGTVIVNLSIGRISDGEKV